MIKKAKYWIRLGVAMPVLYLGFGMENLAVFLYHKGEAMQDLATRIEGVAPDGS